jgi:cell division topological specificity factor
MIDFFKRIFGYPTPASGATAKERLRLVLLSDHLSLAPEVIEALKRDLLGVISRYVEIDENAADVTFEHRDREIAMLASVPIRSVLSRPLPPPSKPPSPPPSNGTRILTEVPPRAAEPAPALSVVSPQPEGTAAEPPLELAPQPAASPKPAANPSRRRRRRKKAASGPSPLQMSAAHL